MASSNWPLLAQRNAQVRVGDGELRVELDGLLVAGDGLVQLALVIQRNAQVVMCGYVCRGGGHGRLIPAQPLVRPFLLADRVCPAECHQ